MTVRYLPVTLFSLKPAEATSTGGKTLLVVTPYAVKMALLDAAIRTQGVSAGEQLFPALRDLSVALAPPENMVVIKTFGKSWRPAEIKESRNQKAGESLEAFEERMHKMEQRHQENSIQGKYPYYPTIAFREYVYYPDAF